MAEEQVTQQAAPEIKTETKTPEVNTHLLEIESARQKLDKDRKDFEAQVNKWKAETSKPATSESSFDLDEALTDPEGYFKQHSLDSEALYELAQAIIFAKFPQRATPDYQLKRQERMTKAMAKKLERQMKEQQEKAAKQAEDDKAQQTVKAIFDRFATAAKGITAEKHPHLVAWFGNDEGKIENETELVEALIEVAAKKEQVVEIDKLADELEGWLGPRFARFGKRSQKSETGQPEEQAQIVSVNDTSTQSRGGKKTESERLAAAIAAAQGIFIKKD